MSAAHISVLPVGWMSLPPRSMATRFAPDTSRRRISSRVLPTSGDLFVTPTRYSRPASLYSLIQSARRGRPEPSADIRIGASQGKGCFHRQYAVADFDPAPQL